MIGRDLFVALTSVAFLQITHTEGSELIKKWLTQSKETIRLVCPHNHVIYNPNILSGISTRNCTATSENIQIQLNTCFWRQRCEITLINCDKITCNGTEDKADHVIIETPLCIPKGIIFEACAGKKQFQDKKLTKGVIRSHQGYPSRPNRQTGSCGIYLPIRHSESLVIASVSNGAWRKWPAYTTVFAVTRGSLKETIVNTTDVKMLTMAGSNVAGIRIVARFSDKRSGRRRKKKAINKGFAMPFAMYKTKALKEVLAWPKASRSVMREIGWIYEVRGVIEQCTTGKQRGRLTLTCDEGDVIYSPAFANSGYTRNPRARCMFGRYPCGGFTAQSLIQQKSCYWQPSCDVTWSGTDVIVLSKRKQCIGYRATSLGLSGHRCVPKASVFDLCTNCTDLIKAHWGIVRSHPQYPWFFDKEFSPCKRVIRVGKRHQLMLLLQDINLDPDGRDKFTIEHIVRRRRQEVMNAKSATEGRQLILRGGKVAIKLTPFSKTKAGRGLVIVFRRRPIIKGWPMKDVGYQSTDFYAGDQPEAEVLDTADVQLSNRRLCSGPNKLRKKGKACGRRVWSDFFIRLE